MKRPVPWRTIRCVVEVRVPPGNRATERDLVYQVEQALSYRRDPPLARPFAYAARPRVLSWARKLGEETRKRGIANGR